MLLTLALAAALSADATPAVQSAPSPNSPAALQKAALMQQLRLQCHDADAVLPAADKAMAAMKAHDAPQLKTNAEAIIANCGTSPASVPARMWRAQIAWSEKDYRGVLSWLEPIPRGRANRLSIAAGLVAMQADEALAQQPNAAAERTQVIAAVDGSLSRQPGARLDSFEVDGAKVAAYSAVLNQGSFRRLIEFVVTPQTPSALPQSLMLTEDLNAEAMVKLHPGQLAPYFLDFYTCSTHVTVKLLPAVNGGAPTYDSIKPLVIAFLQTGGGASSTTPNSQAACAWPQYVAPIAGN